MAGGRKIYLESMPAEQALTQFLNALAKTGWRQAAERIPTELALGRVTAEGVQAHISAPHYNASAMDGVAVNAADTFGASETSPVLLKAGVQAIWVDTGDAMPAGTDAVIMVEDINEIADGDQIEIYHSASPWHHVRPIGEDLVASELVVAEGTEIGPPEIGALLATGITEIMVWPRPRVTFIPTGTELIQPTSTPRAGDIIEFNSRVILACVAQWGGLPSRHEIVPDVYAQLKSAIQAAVATSDIVVVNAGSSAGSGDHTVHVLSELGHVIAHGVAIKPGKPVMLAVVAGKPVIGLPGYPVSTYLTADLFLRPLVYAHQGLQSPQRPRISARLSRRITSPMGVEDFVRVKLGDVGGRVMATPIGRGAGVISSLVRSDGLLIVPANLEGIEEGQQVEVELRRPEDEVRRAVVAVGSHDIVLDLLSSHLRRSGRSLSSAHAGSLGGLAALRRGEAHMAGTHMLDEETGDYNLSYIQRYVNLPCRLLLLCRRDQGFMVQQGNPKGINGFGDLTRPGISFVNRQRGAGTRILLDYELKRAGIAAASVNGYRREEFTHLAIAAAVKAGTADCGLGILAAARALGCDFVPITQEEYELCIPDEHWEHPGIQSLLSIIQDVEWRASVEALGGYDLKDTGRIREVKSRKE